MASPSSDDDDDERSHPLAQDRPGVYVQVMSPRRRKARVSIPHEGAEQASDEAPPEQSAVGRVAVVVAEVLSVQAQSLGSVLETALDAQPKPMPVPAQSMTNDGDSERPSGEREIVTERPPGYARQRSENSNARGDLVVVTLPPPPRLPSFLPPGLEAAETLDRISGMPASLLEAPMSLRPQEAPAARGRSWMVLAFVVALSAIVSSALLVALRDSNVAEPAVPESNAPAPKPHPELGTSPSAVAQPNPVAQPSLPPSAAAQRVVVTPAPAPAPVVAAPAVAAHAAAGTAVRSTANGAAGAPVRPLGTSSLPQAPSAVPGAAASAPAAQNVAASLSPQLQAPVRPPAPAPSTNPAASSASVEQPSELPENPYND